MQNIGQLTHAYRHAAIAATPLASKADERADVLARPIPDWTHAVVEVDQRSFFAVVGRLNVHPYPVGAHCPAWGYRSDWRMCAGSAECVAHTVGGTPFNPTRYFVTPQFHRENRAALTKAAGGGA